jgi:hypothetical protein
VAVLVLGIVLVPQQATAVTVLARAACGVLSATSATTRIAGTIAVRREPRSTVEYSYDEALARYDYPANARTRVGSKPERPPATTLATVFAAKGGATSTGSSGAKQFTPEQRDLVEMAKGDKAAGGVTPEDMEAYKELNAQAGANGFTDPGAVRGPEVHPLRTPQSTLGPGQEPHGHVGPVDHIPVRTVP